VEKAVGSFTKPFLTMPEDFRDALPTSRLMPSLENTVKLFAINLNSRFEVVIMLSLKKFSKD